MITGIIHFALLVRDYDEAKKFYCGILNFEVVEDTELDTKRWLRIAPPGYLGSEILLSKATNDQEVAQVGNQAGGRVLLFLKSDDLEADFKKLSAEGVEFAEQPRTEAYGKVAVFKDLYGNRIDLIQPLR